MQILYSLFATETHIAVVLGLILATVAVQCHRLCGRLLELRYDVVKHLNGLRYLVHGDGLQRLQQFAVKSK